MVNCQTAVRRRPHGQVTTLDLRPLTADQVAGFQPQALARRRRSLRSARLCRRTDRGRVPRPGDRLTTVAPRTGLAAHHPRRAGVAGGGSARRAVAGRRRRVHACGARPAVGGDRIVEGRGLHDRAAVHEVTTSPRFSRPARPRRPADVGDYDFAGRAAEVLAIPGVTLCSRAPTRAAPRRGRRSWRSPPRRTTGPGSRSRRPTSARARKDEAVHADQVAVQRPPRAAELVGLIAASVWM
jgi:hypothetical protein